MTHKFQNGDRVRVVKIDNMDYYDNAKYQIGDIGTIIKSDSNYMYEAEYCIDFDRLKTVPGISEWFALEEWLQPVEK